MSRLEPSLPVGEEPICVITPGGHDDEITYESGGISYWLIGVAMICVVLWLGSFIVGFKTASIVVITFGVVAAAWVYYQGGIVYPRRRAEAMREAATALGLAYRADVPTQQLEQLRQMLPFSVGTRHQASNMLAGTCQGMPVYLLDYYYHIPGGKSTANFWQTVVLFPEVSSVPEFYLAPRRFIDKVAQLLDSQDITFSKDATRDRFSRHYLLRGPQEQAIRAAFERCAVGYLADHPGWTVSCGGGHLAVWRTVPTEAEASANFKLTGMIDPGFRYVVPAAIPRLLARSVALRRLFAEDLAGSIRA
jgi:hypothetical protein